MTCQCPSAGSIAGKRAARVIVSAGPFGWALALFLLPKCPLCGVTYLSLAGLAALPSMPGWERWWPLIAMALVFNVVWCLYHRRTAKARCPSRSARF